jgi:negative regulator of sigma E activity
MADQDEKLSYLLDDYPGENGEAELDELLGDVNLQYRARRYQMIGAAMRHELPQAIDTDFHTAVMSRIPQQAAGDQVAQEPVTERPSLLSWLTLKPFAGLAVAASVALVTVALWQPLQKESGQLDNGGSRSRERRFPSRPGCSCRVRAGRWTGKCPLCSRSSMLTW